MTTNDPPPYPGDSPGSDESSTGSGDSATGSGDSSTSGLPSYGSVQPPEGTPPPPPPPPPSAPGGSAEGFSAPDAIGYGWEKFKANPAPLVIAALLIFAVEVVLNLIGRGIGGSDMGMGMGGGFSIGGFVWSLVSYAVTTVFGAIYARGALDVVDGGEFNLGSAFGKLNIVNVIIASVIVSVLVTIGFILLVIPGVVVLFLTYFTTLYVVDDDASSPVDAVRDSVKLIGANVGDSLLLALLNILVLIVGVIALCVGLLVAYPVVALASAFAYRTFRGQPVAA